LGLETFIDIPNYHCIPTQLCTAIQCSYTSWQPPTRLWKSPNPKAMLLRIGLPHYYTVSRKHATGKSWVHEGEVKIAVSYIVGRTGIKTESDSRRGAFVSWAETSKSSQIHSRSIPV